MDLKVLSQLSKGLHLKFVSFFFFVCGFGSVSWIWRWLSLIDVEEQHNFFDKGITESDLAIRVAIIRTLTTTSISTAFIKATTTAIASSEAKKKVKKRVHWKGSREHCFGENLDDLFYTDDFPILATSFKNNKNDLDFDEHTVVQQIPFSSLSLLSSSFLYVSSNTCTIRTHNC